MQRGVKLSCGFHLRNKRLNVNLLFKWVKKGGGGSFIPWAQSWNNIQYIVYEKYNTIRKEKG